MVKPAPVIRRPYDSLNSPYPTGCSRLCNHPVSKDIKREYKDVMKKSTNESDGKTILLPDEEIQVREEISRATHNSSPALSSDSSLQRPDSELHVDDDEDRIPDELLLKYTKADSLGHDDFPSTDQHPGNQSPALSTTGGQNDQHTPRSATSESGRRCTTPDRLPLDDPDDSK
jgi:hypothetical protein